MEHILNKIFDKVYCINLINRPDKRSLAKESFDRIGLEVEFFDAIKYEFGTMCSNLIRTNKTGYFNLNSTSEFGCFMSHYAILKKTKDMGYKSVLILEDDVCFLLDFNDKIQHYFNELPSDWDIISLYRVLYEISDKNKLENKLWCTYYKSWSTMVYGLRNNGIDAMLDYYSVFPCIADLPLYNNLENENIKFYSTTKPLCVPNINMKSDLRGVVHELSDKNKYLKNISFDDFYIPKIK